MRFDPGKKREQPSSGISPFPAQRGGNAEKGKTGLFITIVYWNYLIFHLLLLFTTPTHVLGLTLTELTSKTTAAAVSGGHSARD